MDSNLTTATNFILSLHILITEGLHKYQTDDYKVSSNGLTKLGNVLSLGPNIESEKTHVTIYK